MTPPTIDARQGEGILPSMKAMILLLAVVLVGGCASPSGKALMKQVIGTYEMKDGGATLRIVFLKSGIMEGYKDGVKEKRGGKWTVKDGEVHVEDSSGSTVDTGIFRIEPNGDLTGIAGIKNGKRKNTPEDQRMTIKKIK